MKPSTLYLVAAGVLAWIGYFHWAIPAGMLMFAVWLFVFAPIDTALVRGAFGLSTAAAGAAWFVVVHVALLHHFAAGPGALVRLLVLGERLYRFSRYGVHAAVPLTPLVFAGLLWACGRKPGAGRLALALGLLGNTPGTPVVRNKKRVSSPRGQGVTPSLLRDQPNAPGGFRRRGFLPPEVSG